MDGKELMKQTLDQIPQTNSNAKRLIGLVKEGSRITGYQLFDNSIVKKAGSRYGKARSDRHQGDTEYLKSIPDGSENNKLSNLPFVSPET